MLAGFLAGIVVGIFLTLTTLCLISRAIQKWVVGGSPRRRRRTTVGW